MLTLLKTKKEFDKEWLWLKKKDESAIEKVERRFSGTEKFDREFVVKVFYLYDIFKTEAYHITKVLKEYLDNEVYELWFGAPFNEAQVYNALIDVRFVGMLMCDNLLRRTIKLEKASSGQLKLRVYIAILNYDRYKLNKKRI